MTIPTFRPLLPALLLALAACVVNTDDLAPKSDAECAAVGQKACGPKCVPIDDPATGCAGAGCFPCPGAMNPGEEPYCNLGFFCAYRTSCGPTGTFCEGAQDAVCEDLATDASNCGACGHACGGGVCTNGLCTPVVVDPVAGSVSDLVTDGNGVYRLVQNYAGGGGNGCLVGGGEVVIVAPNVDRAVMDGSQQAFVSIPGGGVAEVSAGLAGPFYSLGTGTVRSLAMDAQWLWLTNSATTEIVRVSRSDPANATLYDIGAYPTGIAASPIGGRVAVGAEDSTIRWVASDLSGSDTIASPVDYPAEVAVFYGQVGAIFRTMLFWITYDGLVYAKELEPTPGAPVREIFWWPRGTGMRMDLYADSLGVYWADPRHGIVAEWRALSDDVVLLAEGGSPVAVLAWGNDVYWADSVDETLKAVRR